MTLKPETIIFRYKGLSLYTRKHVSFSTLKLHLLRAHQNVRNVGSGRLILINLSDAIALICTLFNEKIRKCYKLNKLHEKTKKTWEA